MQNNIISTDRRTFLIKFNWTISGGQFIFQTPSELVKILKEKEEKKGIEYIKEFNPIEYKFKRVSKQALLDMASWETENILYLQNHSYFKK